MAEGRGVMRLPLYTRINGKERRLGTIEVPIDVVEGRLEVGDDGVHAKVDWQRASAVDIPGSRV